MGGRSQRVNRIAEFVLSCRIWLGDEGRQAPAEEEAPNGTRRRRRRKMSAQDRKRISDAQKARWPKQKVEAPGTEAAPAETVVAKAKRGPRGVKTGAAKRGRRRCLSCAKADF